MGVIDTEHGDHGGDERHDSTLSFIARQNALIRDVFFNAAQGKQTNADGFGTESLRVHLPDIDMTDTTNTLSNRGLSDLNRRVASFHQIFYDQVMLTGGGPLPDRQEGESSGIYLDFRVANLGEGEIYSRELLGFWTMQGASKLEDGHGGRVDIDAMLRKIKRRPEIG